MWRQERLVQNSTKGLSLWGEWWPRRVWPGLGKGCQMASRGPASPGEACSRSRQVVYIRVRECSQIRRTDSRVPGSVSHLSILRAGGMFGVSALELPPPRGPTWTPLSCTHSQMSWVVSLRLSRENDPCISIWLTVYHHWNFGWYINYENNGENCKNNYV